MRDPKWTDEQWQAVTARGSDLLVAAAAGSGKTAVLVERIIGILKEGVDVDRLLVVTFTNAAAAEMRERIGAALTKELAAHPEQKHLRHQLVLLNRAPITTLHSFCLDLVRRHYYRLDIDPAFRVADETEIALLRQDVLDDVFESLYEQAGEMSSENSLTIEASGNDGTAKKAFTVLADAYGGDRDDMALQEMVLQLYDKAMSQPWPEQWLQDILQVLREAVQSPAWEDLPWFAALRRELSIDLAEVEGMLIRALALCRLPGGPAPYADGLNADIQMVQDMMMAAKHSWGRLHELFKDMAFARAKAVRGPVDEGLKEEVTRRRNQAKKKLTAITEKYFNRSPQDLLADLQLALPAMEALVEVVLTFQQEFRKAKLEKRLVDFNDLEHFCLRLLLEPASERSNPSASSLAFDLKDHFHEVLTDEYQDTNMVQETMLRLLANQNRFMVGDVKQSIYRFRLAEPGLFLEKYRSYSTYGESTGERDSGLVGQRIDLAKNFRSRSNVIHGVNFIFRQIMTEQAGEMDYDAKAELVHGAIFPALPDEEKRDIDRTIELHLIQRQPDENDEAALAKEGGTDDSGAQVGDKTDANNSAMDSVEGAEESDLQVLEAAQYEARIVAKRIQELVDSAMPVFDKDQGGYRPIAYRDIVILMRGTRGRADTFLEEFRAAGVPAYAEVGTGYFEATEISVMLSLLRVIDNPRQDIPLVATLRSPLFQFTAEELAQIRLADSRGSYYEAARAFIERVEGAGPTDSNPSDSTLAQRLSRFFKQVEDWRTLARRNPLSQLIWQIYQETGYYDYAGAMPGGGQRQANLRALHFRARQYEATSFRGLFRFLRFIERLQDQGGDLGTARALGEKENVVRIMSIHKSKGLEFPVVFVTALGTQFNKKDLYKDLLIHKNLGLGPIVVDTKLRFRYPTVAKLAIQRRLYRETLAEEMRILYVALTRAKEKLILVGTVRNMEDSARQWVQDASATLEGSKAESTGIGPLPDEVLLRAKSYIDWIGPSLSRHRDGKIFVKWAAGFLTAENSDDSAPKGSLSEADLAVQEQAGTETEKVLDKSGLSRWKIQYWPKASLLRQEELEMAHRPLNPEWIEKLHRIEPVTGTDLVDSYLSWQYPHRDAAAIPAKVAVSKVKDRFDQMNLESDELPGADRWPESSQVECRDVPQKSSDRLIDIRPRFLQQQTRLSAVERGSAVHLVMQHLNYAENLTKEAIQKQVDSLVEREILTGEQRDVIELSEILRFVESPLGQRLGQSKQILREVPFSLALSAQEVEPKSPPGEFVVVQGVIDCLFEELDGWVLLDYKTDHRPASRSKDDWIEDLFQRYRGQINLYHRAIEKIMGTTVKDRYLYMISTGQELAL
ncbi:AAA family ATPase [Heliobacillus mobilis]|uniref:ATP-dependent helicase/nuclease subunit A n=1 Tax=Heliobacterium mobile TaxID=28064 RepID=A0A6I3SHG6_HELMO|nr:AAA family ATPase [Heliobacterium mobile]